MRPCDSAETARERESRKVFLSPDFNEKGLLAASLDFSMCPHGSPPIPARDAKIGDGDEIGGEGRETVVSQAGA